MLLWNTGNKFIDRRFYLRQRPVTTATDVIFTTGLFFSCVLMCKFMASARAETITLVGEDNWYLYAALNHEPLFKAIIGIYVPAKGSKKRSVIPVLAVIASDSRMNIAMETKLTMTRQSSGKWHPQIYPIYIS